MFELQNGCICCTLRDEFIQQIEKISNLDSIEVVFVEASGISDPGAVSASFLAYEEDNPNTNVYLTSIVTVVDGDRIYREEISTLIVDQIEFCNFIILNKCDLLSADQLKEVESIVRDFQPRAPIIHSVNGDIDIEKIMTTKPFNYDQIDSSSAIQKATATLTQPGRKNNGCVDEYGITSFVFEARRPFNRTRFMEFVNISVPKATSGFRTPARTCNYSNRPAEIPRFCPFRIGLTH